MTSTPLDLSDAERLQTLRQLDQFREWGSLDEKRYCPVCGTLFAGKDLRITADDLNEVVRHAKCPTNHCNSIAIDWVLPTEEILAVLAKDPGRKLPVA